MKIVLVWRRTGAAEPAAAVGERLCAHFEPVLAERPALRHWSVGATEVVLAQLPVPTWRRAFCDEDGERFAVAPDYPLNLEAAGVLDHRCERAPLLQLADRLARDPEPVLAELAPPFSCVWNEPETGGLRLQVDGLGQSNWFEHRGEHVWAVTNRIGALRALGVELRPVAEEWATRFALGWFPADQSGYAGVRVVAPGTQICADRDGVRHRRLDVLSGWVHPDPAIAADHLEAGRRSIVELLAEVAPLWERATVGLSGGRDSRAVTAVLRSLEARFDLRVRGHPERLDVIIAQRLAEIAGLPIRVSSTSALPPDSADGCRSSVESALVWQDGYMTALKHKTFLAKGKLLDGGVVNVMGQHAGIGKGDFAAQIRADQLPPEAYEDALVASLLRGVPAMFQPHVLAAVEERVRHAYRQAAQFGVDEGLHRLHFFFLYEYTRRWGAATVGSQTGLVIAPFLNPGFIRAAYAAPPESITARPFHGHITAHHAPDWVGEPIESEVPPEDVKAGKYPPRGPIPDELNHRPRWHTRGGWRKYDHVRYWRAVGAPLVEEALDEQGWWTEIFDPNAVAAAWQKKKGVADAAVIAHRVGRR